MFDDLEDEFDPIRCLSLENKYQKLRSAIAYVTGRLDIIPRTEEGKLCIDVRNYLLNALEEQNEYE